MNYYFLRAILFTLLSALTIAQNPINPDYDDEAPPPQTGGQRSVPVFVNVHSHPRTSFSCADKQPGQYYADPETKCAVYYVCIANERGSMSPQSFACPNGTLFSQSSRVCREHDQVYCPISTRYYDNIHGNIDSKGQEELYNKPSPLQPWRAPAHSPPPRSQSRPQSQPQSQPPAQPQARPQPQSRPQPQPQPQPAPRPQPQPLRPLPISIGAPPNSRRSQFTSSSSTPAPPPPPPPSAPAAAPVEYEYEYVDYPLPNDTVPNRPVVTPPVRTKRESPIRRKGHLPNPFEFLSAPHIITSFNCEDKVPGIAYADTQAECKMFHVCIPFAKGKLKDYQLYCEANKAMNQETGLCEPKEKVNCGRTLKFYVYNKWFRPQESRKDSWKSLMKKSMVKS